jgi:hypothetical protein
MAKSAFEKWKAKNSVFGKCRFWEIVFNAGRLDGLEWVLRQKTAIDIGRGETVSIIDDDKIKAEIKKIKGS